LLEAAVFLVAAGVIALLFARAERREFHMPGSDGGVVMVAGVGHVADLLQGLLKARWARYPVGIQWGFFLAFVAGRGAYLRGLRMRATTPKEPPLVRGAVGNGPQSRRT